MENKIITKDSIDIKVKQLKTMNIIWGFSLIVLIILYITTIWYVAKYSYSSYPILFVAIFIAISNLILYLITQRMDKLIKRDIDILDKEKNNEEFSEKLLRKVIKNEC